MMPAAVNLHRGGISKSLQNGSKCTSLLLVLLIIASCNPMQRASPPAGQRELEFPPSGLVSLSIPSQNGNNIAIRIRKPEGDGPFPTLIGVAGDDAIYAFRTGLPIALVDRGIVAVDFAPQGRGGSEGEDNHNGSLHQDDLTAIVGYMHGLPFVQKDNIGILSYSYGVVMATGALARHPEMPVAFLIDWEGPASPGPDIRRGLERGEDWVDDILRLMNNGEDPTPQELREIAIHGGSIFDDAYWSERDASQFAADLPCPYLRVQFDHDHAQGSSKAHMVAIVNAATEMSGQWTRVNDNPPNIEYSQEDTSAYHFHHYPDDDHNDLSSSDISSVDDVLFDYAVEMFFSPPFGDQ
jgi:hypothetical protein